MDLKKKVRAVMPRGESALTVDQVFYELAESIKDEIRSTLNTLADEGELDTVRGSGPHYRTTYKRRPIERRA